METFQEIRDWVCAEVNDTSTSMQLNVNRYIHNIYSDQYIGTRFSWNLNVTNWSIASGASTIALPSNFSKPGRLWNTTYGCEVVPKSYAQMQNYAATSGVVMYFARQGGYFAHNPCYGTQVVRLEWYPQFASLASNGAVPIIPDKMLIAFGAKWLALQRLEKYQQAGEAKAQFYTALQAAKEDDGLNLISIEDSEFYVQEG